MSFFQKSRPTERERGELMDKAREYFKRENKDIVESERVTSPELDDKTYYMVAFRHDPFNSSASMHYPVGRRYIVTFLDEPTNDEYLTLRIRYQQEPAIPPVEKPIDLYNTDIGRSTQLETIRIAIKNFKYILKLKEEPESILKKLDGISGGNNYRKKSKKTYKKTQKKNKSRKYLK